MKNLNEMYELSPSNGRKSFYGKAIVEILSNGDKILRSYGTPVMRKDADGTLHRLYCGWTSMTGNHIKSFCGLDKKQYLALPAEEA